MESVITEDLVNVGEVPLRVMSAGDGPTVVVLHGRLGLHWTPGLRRLITEVMPRVRSLGASSFAGYAS